MTFVGAFILANLITGAVGAGYIGAHVGSKIGKAVNRRRFGRFSIHNEIVTIRCGKEVVLKRECERRG